MDDLISEFVTETLENLSILDQELVRFEQSPSDEAILSNIFRMMHTIKGTCGFLGLQRLEKVAHAGEDVLGRFRDCTLTPTQESVTLILSCIDKIRGIVERLMQTGAEGDEDDSDLIASLRKMADSDPSAQQSPVSLGQTESKTNSAPTTSPAGFPVAAELLAEFDAISAESPKEALEKASSVQATTRSEEPSTSEHKVERVVEKTDKVEPQAQKIEVAKDKIATQTIRVNVDVLENLMTLVSEMVLNRNQLLQLLRTSEDSPFKEAIHHLSRTTSELQEGVMKTRMQPIGTAWSKLPRIVRDLANELGKKINLVMIGEDTELDRQVLELIQDPLTHMVRNSADHGLEIPQDRLKQGKDEVGTIRLSASHEGGHIIIVIEDDGRGINTEKVRQKILDRGLATESEIADMDDSQVNQYIMRAGFSTAEKVTKVSGRGVGMDVVRSNIEKIGGTVEFSSVYGKGSIFTIKIPLTLAIVSSLIVLSGGERFALPQIAVNEVVRISERSENKIESLKGAPILRLRERLLPLVNLSELLQIEGAENAWHAGRNTFEGYVVVCRVGSQAIGVIVDSISDSEEIVVKPLSAILGASKYFSGNTILGDGRVILILDINGLASSLSQELVQQPVQETQAEEIAARLESILLFQTQLEGIKAVPLSQVQRIEHLDMTRTEVVQGEIVVQYRNGLLPLVSIDGISGIHRLGKQQVLVFGSEERSIGLAISSIVDITQDELKILKPSRQAGLLGSGIISGRAVDIVDPSFFVSQSTTHSGIEEAA